MFSINICHLHSTLYDNLDQILPWAQQTPQEGLLFIIYVFSVGFFCFFFSLKSYSALAIGILNSKTPHYCLVWCTPHQTFNRILCTVLQEVRLLLNVFEYLLWEIYICSKLDFHPLTSLQALQHCYSHMTPLLSCQKKPFLTFSLDSVVFWKAQFSLHCSQATGAPYFFSELKHLREHYFLDFWEELSLSRKTILPSQQIFPLCKSHL